MEELTALKTALSAKDQIIADLQAKVKKLEKRADELDQYTDDLEQYSRRNSLRIQGLPEAPGEDEDPMEKTLEFANCTLKLNPPLLASDIDRAHRTGKPRKPGQPRAFLIKFATYQQRRRVLMSKQLVRKTSIYINEDLTPKRAASSPTEYCMTQSGSAQCFKPKVWPNSCMASFSKRLMRGGQPGLDSFSGLPMSL